MPHRLLLDSGYALLNIGINVKHWTKAYTVAEASALRTALSVWEAIASSEAGPDNTRFASTFFRDCQHLVLVLSKDCIQQWHGGTHLGIEAAKRPESTSYRALGHEGALAGATSSAPAGFAGLATKYLSKGDVHFRLLMPACLFHLA